MIRAANLADSIPWRALEITRTTVLPTGGEETLGWSD